MMRQIMTMRKLVGTILLLLCGCVLALGACDDPNGATEASGIPDSAVGSSDDPGDASGPDNTALLVLGDYALWGQTLKYENPEENLAINITVSLPEKIDDADGMADPSAHALLAMKVAIENVGKEAVEVNPSWFTIKDADGIAYEPIEVSGIDLEALSQGTVDPGTAMKGYLFFEVPDAAVATLAVCDPSLGTDPGAVRSWSE